MAEALGLVEQAYAGQARRLGPVHPATLETLDVLGFVLLTKGDYEAAEAAYRRAIDGRRRSLGPGHPRTLQSTKMLGWVYSYMERWDEAIRLSHEVAEGHRQTYGLTHIQTSSTIRTRKLATASLPGSSGSRICICAPSRQTRSASTLRASRP